MPKLKQSPEAFSDQYLKATIKKYINIYDIDLREAGASVCLTEKSMYNRFKKPSDFKVSEIRGLCKKLKIPPEELIKGIFPEFH